jgi:hypothetical protein
LKVIQKIFRVFQNPHVIYATTWVNSFTIFLLSLFYCRQNLCRVNIPLFRRTSWWSRYVPFFVKRNEHHWIMKSGWTLVYVKIHILLIKHVPPTEQIEVETYLASFYSKRKSQRTSQVIKNEKTCNRSIWTTRTPGNLATKNLHVYSVFGTVT